MSGEVKFHFRLSRLSCNSRINPDTSELQYKYFSATQRKNDPPTEQSKARTKPISMSGLRKDVRHNIALYGHPWDRIYMHGTLCKYYKMNRTAFPLSKGRKTVEKLGKRSWTGSWVSNEGKFELCILMIVDSMESIYVSLRRRSTSIFLLLLLISLFFHRFLAPLFFFANYVGWAMHIIRYRSTGNTLTD